MAVKKVLVVEETNPERKDLSQVLRGAGYDVVAAGNRADAINFISRQPFDLLIADLDLPQMKGVEFIDTIRKIPGHLFTPVIILSEERKTGQRSQCLSAGVSGYIQKPFHQNQLLSVLSLVLS